MLCQGSRSAQLLHTRQHTHHYTHARAPSQPHQSRSALSYTQFCASVCERNREGEAVGVEGRREGERKGEALTPQPWLQGQRGV